MHSFHFPGFLERGVVHQTMILFKRGVIIRELPYENLVGIFKIGQMMTISEISLTDFMRRTCRRIHRMIFYYPCST